MNDSEETDKIKTFPIYPYLLQGQQALPVTVNQYQLDARVTQNDTFASSNHPLSHNRMSATTLEETARY